MGKNIGKKINKILSSKNSLNVPDLAKQFARELLKELEKEQFETQQKQMVI